jgi:CBS domain-containing protein
MNVRDLMTEPITVDPSTSIGRVSRLMVENHLSGLPVVDQRGSLVGVVTESDLVTKHARVHGPTYLGFLGGVLPIETRRQDAEVRRALAVSAGDIMSMDFATIPPGADIEDAATLMVERDANPIAVVEGERLVGMISRADIVRLLVVEEDDG